MSVGKESKCVEATGWVWDGLKHSCFVCRQFFNLFYERGQNKNPLNLSLSFHHPTALCLTVTCMWSGGISGRNRVRPAGKWATGLTCQTAKTPACHIQFLILNKVYLSSLYNFSVQHWGRTGKKALWQNLVVPLALSVLPMCNSARGWCALIYSFSNVQ